MGKPSRSDPASARLGQRLFLVPVGQENEHQHTIDGHLPANVLPTATALACLPCWGLTDGNYLVKHSAKVQVGDVLAFIRAQHKKQPAYVHRLAVVDGIARDPIASELYKVSHDYNMGEYAWQTLCVHPWL